MFTFETQVHPLLLKAEFHLVVRHLCLQCQGLCILSWGASWVSGYLIFWSADESWRKQHGDLFSGHSCPMPALDPMSKHTCTEVSLGTSPQNPTSTQSTLSQASVVGNKQQVLRNFSEWNSTTGKQGAAAQVHAICRGRIRLPRTSDKLEKWLKHEEPHEDKQTAETSDYTYI